MTELKKEFENKFKNALYIFETCDECGGNGMDMEDSYKTCGECHGAGKTKRMNPELWTWIEQKIDEACKKAKIEECKYWQDYIFRPHVSVEQITVIDFALRLAELDNTSPKESE